MKKLDEWVPKKKKKKLREEQIPVAATVTKEHYLLKCINRN